MMLQVKSLVNKPKRPEQKFIVLMSDQTVFIGLEWEAMKKARKYGKPVVDMLPTSARVNSQSTSLTKILESLERETKPEINEDYQDKAQLKIEG
jgi:hypothetical protein